MRRTLIAAVLFIAVAAMALIFQPWADPDALPEGFAHVGEAIPGITLDVRYSTASNFIGAPVDGYAAPTVILTTPAITALARAQERLAPFGLGLKVFDGYRPQQAVNHFVRWAEDLADTKTKAEYYPDVEKQHLFRDGYIAAKSGHSRGSTVDVTIISLDTGKELDMGTPFDFFGLQSWPGSDAHDGQVRANRALLQSVMIASGFKPLETEWWHFTLVDEPHPDTYFDFPVR